MYLLYSFSFADQISPKEEFLENGKCPEFRWKKRAPDEKHPSISCVRCDQFEIIHSRKTFRYKSGRKQLTCI